MAQILRSICLPFHTGISGIRNSQELNLCDLPTFASYISIRVGNSFSSHFLQMDLFRGQILQSTWKQHFITVYRSL